MEWLRLPNNLIIFYLLSIFGLSVHAQVNPFPNELSGFEFFRNVRLHRLKLLISTQADVEIVMGEGCENGCDYNEDWRISFSYVSSNWSKTSGDLLYEPKTEIVGKLWDISFRPKRPIVLTEANVFPAEFKCSLGTTTSGNLKYSSRVCINDKRVIYSISNETISDGTVLILNQQLMYIAYLPSRKDEDEIWAQIEK